MTDGSSKPWLPATTSECPVDSVTQRWVESSLLWFIDEFGTEVLRRAPVLPTADFLSEQNYSGSSEQIEALVGHVCRLMVVDPGQIKLELFDGSADKKDALKRGGSRTVGHFHMEEGRAIIALDHSESCEPKLLTAIAVHELCHLRLLGEDRIRRDRSDGERLTDLLTVYFGFGIFGTNAAMRFARAERNWTVVPRGQLDDRALNAARHEGYHRLGYLSSREFGYALSCYCWLRRETDPDWARYVNPGPLVYLEQGLAYLNCTSIEGELPIQRLLNESAKIGIATVRVTPGKVIGSGPSALMLPNLATPRTSDDAAAADPET